jgi:hypothetical protein
MSVVQNERAARFRALHEGPGAFIIPNPWDAGSLWNPPPPDAAADQAATVWLQSGMQGKPPAGATTTNAFVHFLRAGFEPLRAQAALKDPTTNRRFGRF